MSAPSSGNTPLLAAQYSPSSSHTLPTTSSSDAAESSNVSTMALFRRLWSQPRLLLVVLFVTIGGLLFGYDIGVIGGVTVLAPFREAFNLSPITDGVNEDSKTTDAISWVVSIFTIGCAVAALVSGAVADKLSRRWTVFLGAALFTVGGVLQAAAIDLAMLMIGRLVCGFAIGALSTIVPIYNAELAPPDIRGVCNTLFQLAITFGILIAFLFNLVFSSLADTGWRWSLAFQSVFSVVLLVGIMFLPESPRWLLSVGREDEARNVLKLVRAKQHVVPDSADGHHAASFTSESGHSFDSLTTIDIEMNEIKESLAESKRIGEGRWSDLIGTPLRFSSSPLLATAVVGVVNVVFTTVTIGMIDRFGRVPLLLWGALAMSASCSVIAVIAIIFESSSVAGVLIVIFVCTFVAAFAMSWGPIGWIVPSEIYPIGIRGKAVSICTTVNWTSNFLIAQTVPTLLDRFGVGITFVLFAGLLIGDFVFTLTLLPETKGVSLEGMERLFNVQEWSPFMAYVRSNMQTNLKAINFK